MVEQSFDSKELISLGLNQSLSLLEGKLIEKLADRVPLLGNLGSNALEFISQIKNGVNTRLADLSESTSEAIRVELFELLNDELGVLLDGNNDNTIDLNDIELILDSDGYFLGAKLGNSQTLTQELDRSFGTSELGLDVDGDANLFFDYTFDLGFGLDLDNDLNPQFYLDTSSDTELELELTADLDGLTAQSKLFDLIEIDIADNGSSLNGLFSLDLSDGDDNKWRVGESLEVDGTLSGDATLNLEGKIDNDLDFDVELNYNFSTTPINQVNLNNPNSVQINYDSQSFDNLADFVASFDSKQLISLGFERLLTFLEEELIENLSDRVPLLGDLSDDALQFISQIKNGINDRLFDLSESTSEAIRLELFDLFHNQLSILEDTNNDNTIDSNDIELILNSDGYFLGAKLGGNFGFSTEFATDLGLPNLGLNIEAEEIFIGGEYGFDLGFGIELVDNTPQFYLDTESERELFLNLNANLDNLKARGELGFLQLDIEDINPDNEVEIGISIDLIDSPNNQNQIDNKLTIDELSLSSFETDFNAGVDVQLELITSFDGSEVLPTLNTDFKLLWEFDGESENGNTPSVSFDDVQIDLGTFFNNFANPIFKNIQEITKPIEPIANFLTRVIQFSDTSFSEFILASLFGTDVDLEFVEQIINFVNLVNSIPADSDIVLDLGSFNLGENDPREEEFTLSSIIPNITESAPSLEEQTINTPTGDYIQQTKTQSDNRLQFPIIENPTTAFGLLLGKDVDLFSYQLPDLDVSIDESYPLVVVPFGGVFFASAGIDGVFEAKSDVEFGFDTFGLTQLSETNDVDDIFNGFFIRDNGNRPLVSIELGFEAFAKVAAGIDGITNLGGGLTGGIEGNLGLDLIDPNNDGKVRKDELVSTFSSSPLELFNLIGGIDFVVDGFIAGELFGTSTVFYDQNLITEELLNFTVEFRGENQKDNQSPFLATNLGFENFEEDGILRLNIGADANFRRDGKGDIGEVYVIKHKAFTATNETILVSAFGVVQDYKSIKKIIADAGKGNDSITLADRDVLVPAQLAGGRGDDTLTGGNNNDTLSGDRGDDLLIGSAGADDYDGGRGIDTASYRNSPVGVTLNLVTGFATGDAIGDIIPSSIEGIEGSPFDDILIDNDRSRFLLGRDGNDFLQGNGGNDSLSGENGNDTLKGDEGDDSLHGNNDRDLLHGGIGNDSLYGGDGDDTLKGEEGDDLLEGNNDKDLLHGGIGNDSLYGGNGDDTLNGDEGEDSLWGENGDDIIYGGLEEDVLYGGDLNDSLYGEEDRDYLDGEKGDDYLDGGKAEDTLMGGYGRDTLMGGDDNDILFGNNGEDSLMGENGNDSLMGGNGSDLIFGGSGKDSIHGEGWNDYLRGGNDRDRLFGDDGNDILFGDDGKDILNGGNGDDSIYGGNDRDRIRGGNGNDSLFGDDGNDRLFGNDGDDSLNGGSGNDRLFGGNDNDTIQGSFGNDTIDGENGIDYLYEIGNVDFTATEGQLIGVGTDNFSNIEILLLYGGSSNNTLDGSALTTTRAEFYGEDGNDSLIGGNGADILTGGSGNDSLIGGDGIDTLTGGLGNDRFVYENLSEGNDRILDFIMGEDQIVLTDLLNVTGIENYNDAIDGGFILFDNSISNQILLSINLNPMVTSPTEIAVVENISLNQLNQSINFIV